MQCRSKSATSPPINNQVINHSIILYHERLSAFTHSFIRSFIHWSINQASKRASNQPIYQHTLRQLGTPPTSAVHFITEVRRQNSEENDGWPFFRTFFNCRFFQIFTKTCTGFLNHVGPSCCFFFNWSKLFFSFKHLKNKKLTSCLT